MSLEALTGSEESSVPAPTRRWSTRVLLPFGLLAATTALLIGAAWQSIVPGRSVGVIPVMVKAVEATTGSTSVVAPGWLEPDPFAHYSAALTSGVVEEVTVLEGQRVKRDDIVARLIDDDAKLALSRAEADLGIAHAELARAKADLEAKHDVMESLVDRRRAVEVAAAKVSEADAAIAQVEAEIGAESARVQSIDDEYQRKRGLVESGAVSEGEVRRLALEVEAQRAKLEMTEKRRPLLENRKIAAEADERAARRHTELLIEERHDLRVAEAAVLRAEAAVSKATAARDEGQLRLDRMVVYAGFDGVVMRRLAFPGSRVVTGAQEHSGHIVHIYDPKQMQVRADVFLSDAAAVGVGQAAEITIRAVPDRTFSGRVTRLVHRADVQKNTVEVKVALEAPTEVLKPDMLARVRFLAGATSVESRQRVLIPQSLIAKDGGQSVVWVVAERIGKRGVAQRRSVTTGSAIVDGWIEVSDGLHPGDWLIAADRGEGPPQGLDDGERIDIEREEQR